MGVRRTPSPSGIPAAAFGSPRRTRIGKEEREGLLLEEYRKSGRPYPEGVARRGEDRAGDGPDFLFEAPSGRKVAVEVTELYLADDRSPGEGSLRREQEGLRDAFVRQAEHAFYESEPKGRAASVSFQWRSEDDGGARLNPKLVRKLAPVAAALVSQRVAGSRGAFVNVGEDELRDVGLGGYLVSVQGREERSYPDGRASPWRSSGPSFFPARVGVDSVEGAIRAKETKLSTYRACCDEAWLLLAAMGGPSSFDGVDDEVVERRFRSAFDRVILFCPWADHRVLMLVGR